MTSPNLAEHVAKSIKSRRLSALETLLVIAASSAMALLGWTSYQLSELSENQDLLVEAYGLWGENQDLLVEAYGTLATKLHALEQDRMNLELGQDTVKWVTKLDALEQDQDVLEVSQAAVMRKVHELEKRLAQEETE